MKKLLKIKKMFSSEITLAIVGLFALFTAFVVPWTLTNSDIIRSTLQSLVQINITVAIGMAAISLSLKAKNEYTLPLLREILFILLISVLGFFLSLLNDSLIHQIYISLNGVCLVFILVSTTAFLKGSVEDSTN